MNTPKTAPFLDMANAISCLRLELPETVWDDVSKKWLAVVQAFNATPVPEKVEEAAKAQATSHFINIERQDGFCNPVRFESFKEGFIAGANWQSTQSDAVEFAEWTDDNGWWREVYNFDGDSEKLWSKTSSCWENITTEQLYQLFKQK